MTDTKQYLSDFGGELARAGIRGRRRTRIVAEFADHFRCDPDADLGDPAALAAQFANELGSSFARSAAFQAFVALSIAGILVFVRAVALVPRAATFGTADTVALLISVLAAQVALVAGGLGLLRALQLRRRRTVPEQEASVLARRAGVGLAAGALTIIAFPITQIYRTYPGAVAIGGHPTNLWWPLASAAGLLMLAAAVPAVVRSARVRPQIPGSAGDLLADLGPLRPVATRLTSGSVNRLALITGAILVIVIALAGVAADDPYDGIVRGLLEAGAFTAGYAGAPRQLSAFRDPVSTRSGPGFSGERGRPPRG